MTGRLTVCLAACMSLVTVSCGYHVGAKADAMPRTIRTIAIPPFASATARYQLVDELPLEIGREFSSRTRFVVVPKASDADAILNGNIASAGAFPTIFDPGSGKATSVQILLVLSVKLIDQKTGKVLYARPNWSIREDYQLAVDAHQFFNESGPALDRLSRDVARELVSGVVENF